MLTPKLELFNHYPAPISLELPSLLSPLKKALNHLINEGLILVNSPILNIELIEFNLVDDTTITDVHEQFMDDPTPTDVITFHHGEVFVSYDTAYRESQSRQIKLREEVLRYHIHGILHLAGYDDRSPADYARMHTLQEQLVELYK